MIKSILFIALISITLNSYAHTNRGKSKNHPKKIQKIPVTKRILSFTPIYDLKTIVNRVKIGQDQAGIFISCPYRTCTSRYRTIMLNYVIKF